MYVHVCMSVACQLRYKKPYLQGISGVLFHTPRENWALITCKQTVKLTSATYPETVNQIACTPLLVFLDGF